MWVLKFYTFINKTVFGLFEIRHDNEIETNLNMIIGLTCVKLKKIGVHFYKKRERGASFYK